MPVPSVFVISVAEGVVRESEGDGAVLDGVRPRTDRLLGLLGLVGGRGERDGRQNGQHGRRRTAKHR